jgi:hypothetical protein
VLCFIIIIIIIIIIILSFMTVADCQQRQVVKLSQLMETDMHWCRVLTSSVERAVSRLAGQSFGWSRSLQITLTLEAEYWYKPV